MTLKVLNPYKDLVGRIAARLKEWDFRDPEPMFDLDEQEGLSEAFLDTESEWIFSANITASHLIDKLLDIVKERPHLAYEICRAVADAVPIENPPAKEPHEIWDYLQGFLNHPMMQQATERLIVGWSLSGDEEAREKARQIRAYLLGHFAERMRQKILKARIEQSRVRAAEIEATMEAIYEDQDELDGDKGVKGFSQELYDAMYAVQEAMSSGVSLLIRADNEIAPRLLEDLTTPKRPAEFAAYIAAHMHLPDEDIRTRFKDLSKDETLSESDRLWFAWALAYAKSQD